MFKYDLHLSGNDGYTMIFLGDMNISKGDSLTLDEIRRLANETVSSGMKMNYPERSIKTHYDGNYLVLQCMERARETTLTVDKIVKKRLKKN